MARRPTLARILGLACWGFQALTTRTTCGTAVCRFSPSPAMPILATLRVGIPPSATTGALPATTTFVGPTASIKSAPGQTSFITTSTTGSPNWAPARAESSTSVAARRHWRGGVVLARLILLAGLGFGSLGSWKAGVGGKLGRGGGGKLFMALGA